MSYTQSRLTPDGFIAVDRANTPSTKSTTASVFDEQDHALSKLESLLGALEKMLEPVLVPDGPSDKEPNSEPPRGHELSPVLHNVYLSTQRILRINHYVQAIINRCPD